MEIEVSQNNNINLLDAISFAKQIVEGDFYLRKIYEFGFFQYREFTPSISILKLTYY
ncbi:hypothetical protein KTJ34_00700 [Acinetobacter courvalinii]|uniref:hypothetical protein n=1 Tax=Acinetobacter courvalinii TaxID=280147 RepID=UPI0021D066A6|nr:hypothetical protein [Acinetobacter courvalinii]MCU4575936.1 hypothetical protein [Acinetobacter courvalinii]